MAYYSYVKLPLANPELNIHSDLAKIQKSISDISKNLDVWIEDLNKSWDVIAALAYMTPNNSADVIASEFNMSFNEYLNNRKAICRADFQIELLEDLIYTKKYWEAYPDGEWFPSSSDPDKNMYNDTREEFAERIKKERAEYVPVISWNHYEYTNYPKNGIEENLDMINFLKNKLLGYAAGTPKDIINSVDCEGNPIEYVDAINFELRNIKETLDNTIKELIFSVYADKYGVEH